jgi:hypothetical protein
MYECIMHEIEIFLSSNLGHSRNQIQQNYPKMKKKDFGFDDSIVLMLGSFVIK